MLISQFEPILPVDARPKMENHARRAHWRPLSNDRRDLHGASVEEGGRKGVLKEYITKIGEARPLKLLNISAWLISTCLRLRPFCLRLGDHALALCVLALCVYMQRQRQETSRQAMEGKYAKSIWKRHKADKYDRHGKQKNKKASKQVRR